MSDNDDADNNTIICDSPSSSCKNNADHIDEIPETGLGAPPPPLHHRSHFIVSQLAAHLAAAPSPPLPRPLPPCKDTISATNDNEDKNRDKSHSTKGSNINGEQDTATLPSARLKWCGCLASSPCSHFSAVASRVTLPPAAGGRDTPACNDCNIRQSSSSLPANSFIYPLRQGWSSWISELGASAGTRSSDLLGPRTSQMDAREVARLKAQILAHPSYGLLLAAHVNCLRAGTPTEHLPSIDAQLETAHRVALRYSMLGCNAPLIREEEAELDSFMESYIMHLKSFKDKLQDHVHVQATHAMLSCWELEQAFTSLTGVIVGDGHVYEATMSDDEEETFAHNACGEAMRGLGLFDGMDSLGLGPLVPTESERSLMERVRRELKSELKQGYKSKIADVREEILRKRRAGKLPTETTSILKRWWNAHAKWPYPTEDEKARLVQETGLELKQINNWFINQRKRNWHNHSTNPPCLPKYDTDVNIGGGKMSTVSLTLSCDIERMQSDEGANNFHRF